MIPILYGLLWAWRGYSKPRLPNFLRAFIVSSIMVIVYTLTVTGLDVSYLNCPGYWWIVFKGVIVLTLAENWLGYGYTRSIIGRKLLFKTKQDGEPWTYLAFISGCYSLAPTIAMYNSVDSLAALRIFAIGAVGFPLAVWVDIYLSGKQVKFDTWKVAEFIIGAFIGLAWLS